MQPCRMGYWCYGEISTAGKGGKRCIGRSTQVRVTIMNGDDDSRGTRRTVRQDDQPSWTTRGGLHRRAVGCTGVFYGREGGD